MNKFSVWLKHETSIEVFATDAADAARKAQEARPGYQALSVERPDGQLVMVDDHCEGCGVAIMEGDDTGGFYEDGVRTCEKCERPS